MFLYLEARHFSISEWYSRLYPQLNFMKKEYVSSPQLPGECLLARV